MLFYTLLIFLLCFFTFLGVKSGRIDGVNKWIIPLAFSLKVIVGFSFLYIYTEIYGNGKLSGDAGNFMFESKLLNDVFFQSPLDYFKFIFGFDNLEMASQYLEETKLWGAGKQSIINDSRNIIRVHSLLHFISLGISSIHMIIICSISTIGLVQLVKGIKELTTLKSILTFLIFLLLPSLLFWSSSILKEPFMLVGLGLFVRGLFYKGTILKKSLFLFSGGIILLGFKPYILLCLLPAIAFYLIYNRLPKLKLIGTSLIFIATIPLLLLLFPVKRDFAIQLLSRKQYDFNNIGNGGVFLEYGENFFYFLPEQFNQLKISTTKNSELLDLTPDIIAEVNEGKFIALKDTMRSTIINHGGFGEPRDTILYPDSKRYLVTYLNNRSDGIIDVTMINESGIQLIKNIPEVLMNSLFRPFFNDAGGALKYPSIIEVWGTFLFLLIAIFCSRKLNHTEKGIIGAIVIFIVSLSLLIGWVTPVIGAIVRYRFPVLMGIILIALIIIKVPSRYKR